MDTSWEVKESETYYYIDSRNQSNNEGKNIEEGEWEGGIAREVESMGGREDEPNILGETMDWSREAYSVRWPLGVTIKTLGSSRGLLPLRI